MRMRRYFTILLFLFTLLGFAQENNTIKYDSLLYSSRLRLMAMDSCGDVRAFPSNTIFSIVFFKFGNKKLRLNRFDRYAKRKQHWNGIFYIYSDMPNKESVLWCSVKGYFKIDGDKITLNWDDNFKTQEHFYEFSSNVGPLFAWGSNASGTIEMKGADGIVLNMTEHYYLKKPICVKFVIKKS